MLELEVEFPYVPSENPQFVNELIPHFMKILQNPHVDRDQKLRNYLYKELGILINLEGDDYLEEKHKILYDQLKQLLDTNRLVNAQISHIITGTSKPAPVASLQPSITYNTIDNLPSIAFGKDSWEKYFGDIGVEPPLPANIEEILNNFCTFWPDKKVKETHLLTLIPEKINKTPFTLNYLRKLIQKDMLQNTCATMALLLTK